MAKRAYWYALQTTPMYEKSVMRHVLHIKENGVFDGLIDCRLITEKVTKEGLDRKGQPTIKHVEEKLYPCYLFIHMVPDNNLFYAIRQLSGVARWVGDGNFLPQALTEEEVANIPGLVPNFEADYVVGDTCKVLSGPFEGFIVNVVNISDNGVVDIIINVFGRDTKMTMEQQNLGKHYTIREEK